MGRSQVWVASLAAIASMNLLSASLSRADDDAADTSMSQFQFSGLINSDNVYVRSGADESQYPVLKLSKGDTVVVVGVKGDWLKILPSDGVFCVVGKVWVDKRGDGSVGRVRDGADNTNVRVASLVNDMKSKVVTQLKPGDDVKIIGDLDEYFKIAPPPGVFLYVNKRFVDVVKRVEVVNNNGAVEVKQPDANSTAVPNAPLVPVPATQASPTTMPNENAMTPPTTMPSTQPMAAAPTTGPAADLADFQALETKFTAASKLPLDQQPLAELIDGYQNVVDNKTESEPILKLAAYRLNGLKLRKDTLAQMKASQTETAAIAAREKPLQAEAAEIDQRMKANDLKSYTAVGTLRMSSIYSNGHPFYRLTDPSSGRTVVYLETTDPKITGMEGSFIGVHGTITDDAARQIKYITPQSADAVNPADVTSGAVSSTMTPPSVAPGATGN